MAKQPTTHLQRIAAQPVWSQVTLQEAGRDVRLILPAVGIWRRRKDAPWVPAQSLFWVGTILCVFVALITIFIVLAAKNTAGERWVGNATKDLIIPWPIWAGLVGFWCMSLATILGGLNLCRRQGILEVTDHVLRGEQGGLFGRRQWEWPREQIAAAQTGPTGITFGGGTRAASVPSSGGVRMAELHLYLQDGSRIRLFAGRAENELNWIAGQLRRALQVDTKHYDGE
jgi:hypothetical protein